MSQSSSSSKSGKMVTTAGRTIGDRIKIDILLLMRDPCRKPPENLKRWIDCEEMKTRHRQFEFLPTYTILLSCIQASSSVLLKKADELEKDGLVSSIKLPNEHNKRSFSLTPLGKKVADLLFQIEEAIEEGVSERW